MSIKTGTKIVVSISVKIILFNKGYIIFFEDGVKGNVCFLLNKKLLSVDGERKSKEHFQCMNVCNGDK